MLLGVLSLIEKTCGSDFNYSTMGLKHPQEISTKIKELQKIDPHSVTGRFEWIDGMLIKALEEGHWILMDNVNFCNPSVLDRLNPLLENNGYLLVNERGTIDGQVKIIRPHPNFRIFLTMDPKNGEISRPMRNRGIEICILEHPLESDDTIIMLGSLGIPGT